MSDEFLSPQGAEIDLDETALESALEHANRMADAARLAILPHFRSLQHVDNKLENSAAPDQSGYDPVTVADRAAEQAIREVIGEHRPQDGIYGEEYGFVEGQSGLTWVIDPIDGTRGFVCGLPTWGTLIALHNGSRSVLGVMDQPVVEERFIGYMGAKPQAYISDRNTKHRALRCRQIESLGESLLCITAPEIFTEANVAVYQRITDSVASTRYGTDCYGYAMLAAGCIDVVVEPALSAYDIQALIPIIEAAGGVVSDWSGEPVGGGGDIIAAATPQLHREALLIVQGAG